MKRIQAIVLLLVLSVSLGWCTVTVAGAEDAVSDDNMIKTVFKTFYGESRRIIIDSDTGGDDALAILMAAKSPNITIEGVTVLQGNVSLKQAANNALMTLEIAGCDCGVYLGAATALDGIERETFSVYGQDGMGDKGLITLFPRPVL